MHRDTRLQWQSNSAPSSSLFFIIKRDVCSALRKGWDSWGPEAGTQTSLRDFHLCGPQTQQGQEEGSS